MATVQGAELLDVIVDGGESAKSLRWQGRQRLLTVATSILIYIDFSVTRPGDGITYFYRQKTPPVSGPALLVICRQLSK